MRVHPWTPKRASAAAVLALIMLVCPPSAVPQQQRFTASVNTVRVDAVVTDGSGNFIGDLRPAEFSLFEDGVRQEIVSVDLVDLGDRRVQRLDSEETAGEMAAPRSAGGGVPSALSSTGEQATDLGAIIFFIDLPGLHFRNSADFADSMQRFFERTTQLDLPYAIYLVDMAGRLRELQPLTKDPAALREGARTARATTSPIFSREYLFNALDTGSGGEYRADRGQSRGRTLYTYRLLHDFVDSLAHRAGRTALVWVSTGVDLSAYENVAQPYALLGQQDPTPGAVFRSYSPDLKVLDMQEQLHRAANSANVSIYSVDPSTLADFYLTGGSIKRRDGGTEDARGNSLRNAAHATGGDVFIGWSELDRVLETIERDAGRFYLLSYVPPAAGEGDYHEIRVEVSRPGSEVRARQGYTRYSERERLERTVRSALDLPGTVSGLQVSVQRVRAREADGGALLVVDTAVRAGRPGSQGDTSVGAAPAVAEGSVDTDAARLVDGRSLLVFATVRDAGGELVATNENERVAPAPAGSLPPAGSSERVSFWTHRAAHRLEPGTYKVSVTVLDPRSERVGAASLDVEITDSADEWDTSDPWLVAEEPDGSMSPVIDGRVAAGRPVFMYVEVYGGVRPRVGGNVRPLAGGLGADADVGAGEVAEIAPDTTPQGPSIALTEADGIHRANVPLTSLPPGHYLLDFTITDPGARRSRTVRLPLQVVASPAR